MQTDTIWAHEVENNDFIVLDGKVIGYVYSIEDDGDFLLFSVVDDDNEHTQYPFGAFTPVTIVTSFEDDE